MHLPEGRTSRDGRRSGHAAPARVSRRRYDRSEPPSERRAPGRTDRGGANRLVEWPACTVGESGRV